MPLYLFIILLLDYTDGMEGFKAIFVLFVAFIFIVGIDCEPGKNSFVQFYLSMTWREVILHGGLKKVPICIYNAACKDNYPKNYWKRCSGNCASLKVKGACTKKWNNVLTGNCKRTIPAWHRNRYVSQYCKKTCGRCSKIIGF